VLPVDLTAPTDLAAVEARVRDDQRIGILINNAGAAQGGGFKASDAATIDRLIALNITALARLATAAGQRFASQGGGSIINIGSVVGLIPEIAFGVYGGTKAFVHHLSQSMNAELGGQGVYVQAVAPAATRTEIWERGGMDINTIPDMMDAGDLVDAALVGFDRREQVSLPSLPDAGQWEAYETARKAMIPNLRNSQPAERYRARSPA
jgi:short-subunit dehydrogenase